MNAALYSTTNEPCPHTLCEHIGNELMKCKHCGSIEPVVIATIRVKASDYKALQELFTDVRALMQADSHDAFQQLLDKLGGRVGIQPTHWRFRDPGTGG